MQSSELEGNSTYRPSSFSCTSLSVYLNIHVWFHECGCLYILLDPNNFASVYVLLLYLCVCIYNIYIDLRYRVVSVHLAIIESVVKLLF